MSATTIHNRCRAFDVWPGVWSLFSTGTLPFKLPPNDIYTEQRMKYHVLLDSRWRARANQNQNHHHESSFCYGVAHQNRARRRIRRSRKDGFLQGYLCWRLWTRYIQHIEQSQHLPSKRPKSIIASNTGIYELQPPSKKSMDAKAFQNGLKGTTLFALYFFTPFIH